MEPQQPSQRPSRPPQNPNLHSLIPSNLSHLALRTASSTPVSSPGLFSPASSRAPMLLPQASSEGTTPVVASLNSPYLHPLQTHRVRETHKAQVDLDAISGRKVINQYEVIEEIGRGMHGKVKLARNLNTGDYVAIKIIPRFSKKRRLGKLTALSPQDKTKKEIAILKKIRHPNVVALLEIIDDPELKKIYMVLEHVELGEVVWRKKGLPHICHHERRRVEREMRGDEPSAEEESYDRLLERRRTLQELKRANIAAAQGDRTANWSLEYGADDEDDLSRDNNSVSRDASRATSRAPSRAQSLRSASIAATTHSDEDEGTPFGPAEGDIETPGPYRSNPVSGSYTALEGTMYGPYPDDPAFRVRSPSMADSIISHMSSLDFNPQAQDPFADDYSYVPCFTMDQARLTFRDIVLGLEYLHYEGVVHRDIKPANLLWTKDHRVKISDFGVSYFGRPIRDGELDETISESEARDFDDDLELAKTVGTPAFFAPELCHTDLDLVQPKVSEQIDVWSLGVTLYCLIFARIPFMGEDEFQLFRKIAREPAYIPQRRLRPVNPTTSPSDTDLKSRVNGASSPYRDDNDLAYEEVGDLLHDLLSRMLEKNPERRIRLREVKRHPWVVQGIPDLIGWVDDTDPSRKTAGRRIEVDEKEVTHAVIPLKFLQRATSAVKKAVEKVIHSRSDRAEGHSRRRAASSAASSTGGDSPANVPSTPYTRDNRRRSLRGDDYFASTCQPNEHPLMNTVVASDRRSPVGRVSSPRSHLANYRKDHREEKDQTSDNISRRDLQDRHNPAVSSRPTTRHAHSRSITNAFLSLAPLSQEPHTVPSTPSAEGPTEDPAAILRMARDTRLTDDSSRARSVDRGLFTNGDKRAEPRVGLSNAMAPGSIELPRHARPIRHEMGKSLDTASFFSPRLFSSRAVSAYRHGQPNSDTNIHEKQRHPVELQERPVTAHRVEDIPDAKTPPSRISNPSTPSSFARAQRQKVRRQQEQLEDRAKREELLQTTRQHPEPAEIPCPPSPDDLTGHSRSSSRRETMATNKSASSVSGDMATPLTSPSEVNSPTAMSAKSSTEQILAFQSDPSLPALLSGASSVSADLEGEFLGNPGVINRRSLVDTTDSLTPPALAKEPISGFPLDEADFTDSGVIPVRLDDTSASALGLAPGTNFLGDTRHETNEDGDDSDSDEGLTMAKSRKRGLRDPQTGQLGRAVNVARRRDTNASVGSTDTAKKITMWEESPSINPLQ